MYAPSLALANLSDAVNRRSRVCAASACRCICHTNHGSGLSSLLLPFICSPQLPSLFFIYFSLVVPPPSGLTSQSRESSDHVRGVEHTSTETAQGTSTANNELLASSVNGMRAFNFIFPYSLTLSMRDNIMTCMHQV